jgi:hypothetical protein
MQSARAVLHCHLWPLWLYHIIPHYLINGPTSGKRSYWTPHVCFDFLYSFCLKHFSFKKTSARLSQMYIGLHVKYSLFLPDFNLVPKLEIERFLEVQSIGQESLYYVTEDPSQSRLHLVKHFHLTPRHFFGTGKGGRGGFRNSLSSTLLLKSWYSTEFMEYLTKPSYFILPS